MGRGMRPPRCALRDLKAAAVVRIGALINYPQGERDTLEIARRPAGDAPVSWQPVPLVGDWFPDAFRGTMSNLQRYAAGEDEILITHFEDAYRTMAMIETGYASNDHGRTPIPE